jgi:hypothetical protein
MITELRPVERIIIDTAVLDDLFFRLGDAGAEAVVMDRVEGISDRLATVDGLLRKGDLTPIGGLAQTVCGQCQEIGLTSLARVSRDLGIAAQRRDPVALRAVWERLVRIGDRSLAQVWELPGLSM